MARGVDERLAAALTNHVALAKQPVERGEDGRVGDGAMLSQARLDVSDRLVPLMPQRLYHGGLQLAEHLGQAAGTGLEAPKGDPWRDTRVVDHRRFPHNPRLSSPPTTVNS